MAIQNKQEDPYVQLARSTIEEYVQTGRTIRVPQNLPKEMYQDRAGVFVSIKIKGKNRGESKSALLLRGCIGTIQPVQDSIAEEIIQNAVSAAVKDPRFAPITPEELDRLVISVDVLGGMEQVHSEEELEVKRYGVVVTKGYRRGLLLPNLEGVDTIEEQVAIARQKAGIGEMEEGVTLERFEVVRHI